MKFLFLSLFIFGIVDARCRHNDLEIRGLCFQFQKNATTFGGAIGYCHRQNMSLAYVPDLATSNFLASYARNASGNNDGSAWIGLIRNGTWQWDNGQPVVFTNFGGNYGRDTVSLSYANGKWYTPPSGMLINSICSYDANSTPRTTPAVPTCTQNTPRTFFYAYSTDFNPEELSFSFYNMPQLLYGITIWTAYASLQFDMRVQEDIVYSKDRNSFGAYFQSHKPDPSLGYQDSTTGSNMFDVIKMFLNTTESLCGSTIYIIAKRYPNEVEINDLIAELQRNHVFVYIQALDAPSGGNNPSAMSEIASRTNGYCAFSSAAYFSIDTMDLELTTVPFQVVSQKFQVSGKGNLTIPFKVYNSLDGQQQVAFAIIFQDHKFDGSLKSLNYTWIDSSKRNANLGFGYSGVFECTMASDTFDNDLKIEYEYGAGRQEVMEIRMYAEIYHPDNWLPFNN